MKDWLQPHTVHLVHDQIHSEMECAKPYLHMSLKDVTLDFLSDWDINLLMDLLSQDITPIWSEILDAATEGNESKIHEKGPKSCNRRVVWNLLYEAFFMAEWFIRGRNIISAQVHFLRSYNSCKVQIGIGLMASSSGASCQLINVLNHSCLLMSFTTLNNILKTIANCAIEEKWVQTCRVKDGIGKDQIFIHITQYSLLIGILPPINHPWTTIGCIHLHQSCTCSHCQTLGICIYLSKQQQALKPAWFRWNLEQSRYIVLREWGKPLHNSSLVFLLSLHNIILCLCALSCGLLAKVGQVTLFSSIIINSLDNLFQIPCYPGSPKIKLWKWWLESCCAWSDSEVRTQPCWYTKSGLALLPNQTKQQECSGLSAPVNWDVVHDTLGTINKSWKVYV